MIDNYRYEKTMMCKYLISNVLPLNLEEINLFKANETSELINKVIFQLKISGVDEESINPFRNFLSSLNEDNIEEKNFLFVLGSFVNFTEYFTDNNSFKDLIKNLFTSNEYHLKLLDLENKVELNLSELSDIKDYLLTFDNQFITLPENNNRTNIMYSNSFIEMIRSIEIIYVLINFSSKILNDDFSSVSKEGNEQIKKLKGLKKYSLLIKNEILSMFVLKLSLNSKFYPFAINFWEIQRNQEEFLSIVFQNILNYLLFSNSSKIRNVIYNIQVNDYSCSYIFFNKLITKIPTNKMILDNFQQNLMKNLMNLTEIYYDIKFKINTKNIGKLNLYDFHIFHKRISLMYNSELNKLEEFFLSNVLPHLEFRSIPQVFYKNDRDKLYKKVFNFRSTDLLITIEHKLKEKTTIFLNIYIDVRVQDANVIIKVSNSINNFVQFLFNFLKLNAKPSAFFLNVFHNLNENFNLTLFKENTEQFLLRNKEIIIFSSVNHIVIGNNKIPSILNLMKEHLKSFEEITPIFFPPNSGRENGKILFKQCYKGNQIFLKLKEDLTFTINITIADLKAAEELNKFIEKEKMKIEGFLHNEPFKLCLIYILDINSFEPLTLGFIKTVIKYKYDGYTFKLHNTDSDNFLDVYFPENDLLNERLEAICRILLDKFEVGKKNINVIVKSKGKTEKINVVLTVFSRLSIVIDTDNELVKFKENLIAFYIMSQLKKDKKTIFEFIHSVFIFENKIKMIFNQYTSETMNIKLLHRFEVLNDYLLYSIHHINKYKIFEAKLMMTDEGIEELSIISIDFFFPLIFLKNLRLSVKRVYLKLDHNDKVFKYLHNDFSLDLDIEKRIKLLNISLNIEKFIEKEKIIERIITNTENLSAECYYLFQFDLSKMNCKQEKAIKNIVKVRNESFFKKILSNLWRKTLFRPRIIEQIKKFLIEKIKLSLIDIQTEKSINETIKSNVEIAEIVKNNLG
jgi:hypothetical protein